MRNVDKTPPIGEIIKNFRTWRGITQQEMADYLKKSKSVISNWEHGSNTPDVESCMKMCELLNVTLNELVGWDKNRDYEKFIKDQKEYDEDLASLRKKLAEIDEQIKDIETKKEKKVPRPEDPFGDWNVFNDEIPFN